MILSRLWRQFIRKDEAASLAEYAALLGVLVAVIVLVVGRFRDSVVGAFGRSNGAMSAVVDGAATGGGGAATGGSGTTGGGNSDSDADDDDDDDGDKGKGRDKDKDKGKD